MALRARTTPRQFSARILPTPVSNTLLHWIPSAGRPKSAVPGFEVLINNLGFLMALRQYNRNTTVQNNWKILSGRP